jgi:hypothetical protein
LIRHHSGFIAPLLLAAVSAAVSVPPAREPAATLRSQTTLNPAPTKSPQPGAPRDLSPGTPPVTRPGPATKPRPGRPGRPDPPGAARPAPKTKGTPVRNLSVTVRVLPRPPVTPEGLSAGVHMAQNVPNPFTSSTVISFTYPGVTYQKTSPLRAEFGKAPPVSGAAAGTRVPAKLAIYDVQGKCVATLFDWSIGPGDYAVTWDGRANDGRRLQPGVYVYRLTIGSYVRARKLQITP